MGNTKPSRKLWRRFLCWCWSVTRNGAAGAKVFSIGGCPNFVGSHCTHPSFSRRARAVCTSGEIASFTWKTCRSSTRMSRAVKFNKDMPELLDIPEVRDRISRFSVEEYHQLAEFNGNGRRTELIRGLIIEKMSKSPLHRLVCSRLYKFLLKVLPPGYSVWKEEPLGLRDSEPEPDIAVTRGEEQDFVS